MCLRPGTELVFEKDIEWGWPLFRFFEKRQATGRLVRFRQVNLGWPDTHHDAVEFPNGQIVLLTALRPGQEATVLQLPVAPAAVRQERPIVSEANGPVVDPVPTRSGLADRSGWFLCGELSVW